MKENDSSIAKGDSEKNDGRTIKIAAFFSLATALIFCSLVFNSYGVADSVPWLGRKIVFDGLLALNNSLMISLVLTTLAGALVIAIFSYFLCFLLSEMKKDRDAKAGASRLCFVVFAITIVGFLIGWKLGIIVGVITAFVVAMLAWLLPKAERSMRLFLCLSLGFLLGFGAGIRFGFGIASMVGAGLIILLLFSTRLLSFLSKKQIKTPEEEKSL
jgi:MFS family permease